MLPDALSSGRPRLLRREDAARYVRDTWSIPCTRNWLAKLAVTGEGPTFVRVGRFPLYAPDDLDTWVKDRMSAPMTSTSKAVAIPIKQKS